MTQTENATVLNLFKECDALLQGHFKLTSGKHSEWYFEKIRLIEKPAALEKIVDLLAAKIKREVPDFDTVVSPAYGAIAIGFLAALKLGKRFAFSQRADEKMTIRSGFSGLDRVHPGGRRLPARAPGRGRRDLRSRRQERRRRADRRAARREPPRPEGRGLRAGRLPVLRQRHPHHQAGRLGQKGLKPTRPP